MVNHVQNLKLSSGVGSGEGASVIRSYEAFFVINSAGWETAY